MKVCAICGREYIGDDDRMCGAECKQALELFDENLGRAFCAPANERPGHTFFYDASFGTLVDRWTVLLLHRLKTKDVELQKEIDFHMFRIRKCVETKMADRGLAAHERELVRKVSSRLLSLNARGWHLRCLAKNLRLERVIRASSALELVELGDERAKEVRQLDLLVTGRTHAWKTY